MSYFKRTPGDWLLRGYSTLMMAQHLGKQSKARDAAKSEVPDQPKQGGLAIRLERPKGP